MEWERGRGLSEASNFSFPERFASTPYLSIGRQRRRTRQGARDGMGSWDHALSEWPCARVDVPSIPCPCVRVPTEARHAVVQSFLQQPEALGLISFEGEF